MNQFYRKIPKFVKYPYLAFVGGSTAYGAFGGMRDWADWAIDSKYKTIEPLPGHKIVDPPLNVMRYIGYFGYFTLSRSIVAGGIAAGFPVTMPSLLYLSRDTPDPPYRYRYDYDDDDDYY